MDPRTGEECLFVCLDRSPSLLSVHKRAVFCHYRSNNCFSICMKRTFNWGKRHLVVFYSCWLSPPDTPSSASSVSLTTAWPWKKSLNIWVRKEAQCCILKPEAPPWQSLLFLVDKLMRSHCSSCISVAFRCAYCYFLNPARKTRPQAPRLPEFSYEKRLRAESRSPGRRPHLATDTEESAPPSGGRRSNRPQLV